MSIVYLTVENVIYLHDKILENTPEDRNLAPDTSLESALHRVNDHIAYGDLSDIYEIAALIGIAITKGHCFNNGNKRTGMVSMLVFLYINDINVEADNDDIEQVMVDVATDVMSREQLSDWLRANTLPEIT
ncbi:TPA: type II toxin-antitoxin system death-on-curing family toxin [Legionella pneumophila]|nr:type II toxin-antitoxin system death-on-curing family toxin [Legionella pneumophila]HCJ1134940.1 type II toxin-antitoxin system death-on-curing family toxin [Legionella pneumophila]HCJ4219062.1 type II toxin-antitoxin system death-on-curing family toxin [Legionella pneumophila]HCJ4228743.1 type II toxin-antitoxin system death-on-curing family toxin [Legionella pneumophila]HEL9657942.1 type II toxin-antitoxin system death-on-curing family toxin [Legionella pneumophila]